MEKKETFGKYILEKRKAVGLSQKALASQLFVSESAVSKWERGLSYPDITLVTSLCEILHISEHELLTASDDMHQREIEEQSRGYLRVIRVYSWITYLCYAAALISVFIWGLATGNGLAAFFVVLASLLLVLFGHLFAGTLNNGNTKGAILSGVLFTAITWGIFVLFRYTRLSVLLCVFITAEVCGILTLLGNSIMEAALEGVSFQLPTIRLAVWESDYVNQNLGLLIMICAGVLTVITLVRDIQKVLQAKEKSV
ncbi:MAG: helix-turn-helix domain-containing protein [Lachnospiraceae bacterium]|nr:helix-turn-helix domain-containing protein [Lachnospiraceae bacterium]